MIILFDPNIGYLTLVCQGNPINSLVLLILRFKIMLHFHTFSTANSCLGASVRAVLIDMYIF